MSALPLPVPRLLNDDQVLSRADARARKQKPDRSVGWHSCSLSQSRPQPSTKVEQAGALQAQLHCAASPYVHWKLSEITVCRPAPEVRSRSRTASMSTSSSVLLGMQQQGVGKEACTWGAGSTGNQPL